MYGGGTFGKILLRHYVLEKKVKTRRAKKWAYDMVNPGSTLNKLILEAREDGRDKVTLEFSWLMDDLYGPISDNEKEVVEILQRGFSNHTITYKSRWFSCVIDIIIPW
jgi:ATP/maltotriose-dependent transcriptional regulator MalT